MAFNIGLNVVEVDGAGAPALVGAAVSVGAFNIQTRRGVPNRPARITSFTQFVEQFGNFAANAYGAYLVKGFFDNGGQTAYVNRIVSPDTATGDKAASIVLQDSATIAVDTLLLEAGFRGTADPGSWGSDLYVKVDPTPSTAARILETAPATVQGTALPPTFDMSAFPSLSVLVDGDTQATVLTFGAGNFVNAAQATIAQIRDAINRQTTRLVASVTTNKLVLASTGIGATSLQVSVANATLGFPAAAATTTRGTLAALAATGTKLAGADRFEVGEAVVITDTTNTTQAKVLSVVPITGEVVWTPAIANIALFDTFKTTVSKIEFTLTIAVGGTEDDNVVETWPGLSMEKDVPNYVVTELNDSIAGSRLVMATDKHSASTPGVNCPKAIAFTRISPGNDGTPTLNDFTGDAAKHTGFSAFDPFDVQLLCCERTDPAIVTAALAYCANRGDCIFLGAVPEGTVGAGAAVAYGQKLQGKKVYGALYGPWIKILDPLGTGPNPFKFIPPTGHVMGVYARIETTRGVWKAPAGDEASLFGALDVEHRLSDADHTDLVKNGSVNGIRVVPRSGIVVDASRTLSTDTRWLYVNVRLLFNYVKSSLKQGLRWVRQEPNRDTLWDTVKFNSVIPFLAGLWRQGAFGTGSPSEVFTVICDATNNPPDQVDQGNFKIEVYFYPSKPAETIIIIVGQQPSGAKAAEA